jgi:limonene-1,2-epoxide hydrolase
MESASLAIIEAFAKALDEDDYDLATSLLSAECTYELTGQKLTGRSAVINSFRSNSEWAHANLDGLLR